MRRFDEIYRGLCWTVHLVILHSLLIGHLCTEDVDECQQRSSPCRNGGTCLNQNGTYQCICMNGWTGTDCSNNIDDCATNPCFNGGTCEDRVGSYFCSCPSEKTGLRCQLDNACLSRPCSSSALCEISPIDGSFTCFCPAGLTGSDCKIDINECNSSSQNPCEQGGKCVNTLGSFRCDCQTGLTGTRCEVNINERASQPCQNDGSCLNRTGLFECLCMDGEDLKIRLAIGFGVGLPLLLSNIVLVVIVFQLRRRIAKQSPLKRTLNGNIPETNHVDVKSVTGQRLHQGQSPSSHEQH